MRLRGPSPSSLGRVVVVLGGVGRGPAARGAGRRAQDAPRDQGRQHRHRRAPREVQDRRAAAAAALARCAGRARG